MARYFFHLHECGNITEDLEGVERASPEAARIEALEAARAVMCAELAEGKLCLSCHIEVQNEAGARLFVLPFKEAVSISGI